MLYLNKKCREEIVNHSKEGFPREVCGILAGRSSKVVKVYRMVNTDNSSTSFFMDPHQQLKVMKEIRNCGLEMVGIYHSHPHTQAYPSAKDVELAFYPQASYVIISLIDKESPQIKSFKIVNGAIKEEEIVDEDEEGEVSLKEI